MTCPDFGVKPDAPDLERSTVLYGNEFDIDMTELDTFVPCRPMPTLVRLKTKTTKTQ